MRNVMLVLMLAVVSGCGLHRVENITTPYVATDYLPYAQPGSAGIVGTLSERSIAGKTMTCADRDVVLIPATAYTREAMAITKAGKSASGPASPDDKTLLRSTMRQAKCDASGRFAFSGLAAGSWLVGAEMREKSGDSMTGSMFREVAVANGETLTVSFADTDFVAR